MCNDSKLKKKFDHFFLLNIFIQNLKILSLTRSQKKNLYKSKIRQKKKYIDDKYLSDIWENGKVGIWNKNNEYKYVFPENIHKIPLTRKEIQEKFPHDNESNDINFPYFFEDIKKRLESRPKKEVLDILTQKDRFNTTIVDYICIYVYKEENILYFLNFLKMAPIGFFKNYESIKGENPLHICATCKNINALKHLINLGFDKNQKNKNGHNVKQILENGIKKHEIEIEKYKTMNSLI